MRVQAQAKKREGNHSADIAGNVSASVDAEVYSYVYAPVLSVYCLETPAYQPE